LLKELSVMRVVDRELAKAVAGFDSTTRANARLLALTQAGYLKRSFVGTIAGGRKAVYRLSKKANLIGNAANRDTSGKNHSELFLEHQLQINHIYVCVKHKPIPVPRCEFNRWISFARVLSKTSPLIPDGYLELRHDSAIKSLFLEVDLGTEALRIWQKKVEGYVKLAVSGEFQKLFRQPQFRVIVVASSERRIENIRKVAAKLTDKIFRFASFEIINREGFWSPIWQKPVGDQKQSLL
jgi:hypothetical protein